MNDLSIWFLLGFYALQSTFSYSMKLEPLLSFNYKISKVYSVLALGKPDIQKTRNRDQIFIMGQRNPFFVRSKDNKLTLAGPTMMVLCSADTSLTLQGIATRIKDLYGIQIEFSKNTEIVLCGPSKQYSLYCDLQDAQLKTINMQSKESPCRSCIGMQAKL